MMVFALLAQETALWEIALGLGLVVILVVIALLTLLSRLVNDIDVGVWNLWTITKRAAQNTTGLYQLAGTGSIVRALREELLRHDNLLSGR
jgi:galactitol-specific phosphotransferase system IIC component